MSDGSRTQDLGGGPERRDLGGGGAVRGGHQRVSDRARGEPDGHGYGDFVLHGAGRRGGVEEEEKEAVTLVVSYMYALMLAFV